MKIQLNTDVHIDGAEALVAQVGATVEQALERFSEHVTRVEVHLSDENGAKSGQQDQCCKCLSTANACAPCSPRPRSICSSPA